MYPQRTVSNQGEPLSLSQWFARKQQRSCHLLVTDILMSPYELSAATDTLMLSLQFLLLALLRVGTENVNAYTLEYTNAPCGLLDLARCCPVNVAYAVKDSECACLTCRAAQIAPKMFERYAESPYGCSS